MVVDKCCINAKFTFASSRVILRRPSRSLRYVETTSNDGTDLPVFQIPHFDVIIDPTGHNIICFLVETNSSHLKYIVFWYQLTVLVWNTWILSSEFQIPALITALQNQVDTWYLLLRVLTQCLLRLSHNLTVPSSLPLHIIVGLSDTSQLFTKDWWPLNRLTRTPGKVMVLITLLGCHRTAKVIKLIVHEPRIEVDSIYKC